MKRDTSETIASNGDETLAAQQHLLSERASPPSLRRGSASTRPNHSAVDALVLQVLEGDQDAWAVLEQSLSETMRSWLRVHPSGEAVCCWESEEHYMALAFERFQQAVIAGQVSVYTSLPIMLSYLQACLNGVLLDALRARGKPKGMVLQEPAHAREQAGDCQVWESIQGLFPDLRERRLAYWLFNCHFSPREIFCLVPQEFSNVQEISRLRLRILERILLHWDLKH